MFRPAEDIACDKALVANDSCVFSLCRIGSESISWLGFWSRAWASEAPHKEAVEGAAFHADHETTRQLDIAAFRQGLSPAELAVFRGS
jgi:hypothetical protein